VSAASESVSFLHSSIHIFPSCSCHSCSQHPDQFATSSLEKKKDNQPKSATLE
jgi:hypothetical protein